MKQKLKRKRHEQRGLKAWGPRPFILLSNVQGGSQQVDIHIEALYRSGYHLKGSG